MKNFKRKVILDVLKGKVVVPVPYDDPYNGPVTDAFFRRWQEELGFDPREKYNTRGFFHMITPAYRGTELWDTEDQRYTQSQEEYKLLRDKFEDYLPKELPPGSRISEYGVVTYPPSGGGTHLRQIINPLKDAQTARDVEEYPFPDGSAEWRLAGQAEEMPKFRDEEFVILGGVPTMLEDANFLRGMERFMIDMAEENEAGRAVMEWLGQDRLFIAKRLARMGVDVIGFGDHLANENGSFISRPMLRDWIVRYYQPICEACLKINPDIEFIWHTDGKNHDFIYDELMDIGIRCFNPVQPECDDPRMLKEKYGERIVLWGTVSFRRSFATGKPDAVRAEVKDRMALAKKFGGVILGLDWCWPSQLTYECFKAYYEAAEEFGGA